MEISLARKSILEKDQIAFQKIYKPSRCRQNICQGLVLGARVVIFTAALTLEHGAPCLPSELDMGQCGLLGYDLTPGVYDQGEQERETSPSIKSDTVSLHRPLLKC